MYVRYFSTRSSPNIGFQAKVKVGRSSRYLTSRLVWKMGETVVSATCGGTIFVSSKSVSQVTSPGYPTSYATNLNCEYRIVGPVGHYLAFSFENFDLSRTYNCSGDRVRIEEVNSRGK